MSLFRTERLTIALCPEQVAVLKSGRGQKGAPDEPLLLEMSAESNVPAWKNSVAALDNWLQQRPKERALSTLVLSNRFVRFALLPWAESAQGEAEANALALACFESQYGDMNGWALRLDDGIYGAPRFACAMESALLDALQTVFDAEKIPCLRIEPYFVTCWKYWHKEVKAGDALFAVSESGTTVIASIRERRWHSVRTLSGAHTPDVMVLAGFIARESLLQGFAEPPTCWLHAPTLEPELLAKAGDKIHVMLPENVNSISSSASLAQIMSVVGEKA